MREITRAQKARLGLFLVIAGGVLIALLAVVTGVKFLEKRDLYSVRYRDVSVSGLEVGAQVKYHGVRVGRVEKIYIDPQDVQVVVVELSLEHATPVKKDVKAVITSLSLTGLKIVELEGGSAAAPALPPGSTIPPGESPLQMITGKAEAVSEKLELVLSNLITLTGGDNQQRIMGLVDNTALVLEDVHGILSDNRMPLARTISNLEAASQEIYVLTQSPELRHALASLDSVTSDLQAARLREVAAELQTTIRDARSAFSHFDLLLLRGRHDFLTSLEVLRESMDSFNEFTRLISEDPSLLLRGRRQTEIVGPMERQP